MEEKQNKIRTLRNNNQMNQGGPNAAYQPASEAKYWTLSRRTSSPACRGGAASKVFHKIIKQDFIFYPQKNSSTNLIFHLKKKKIISKQISSFIPKGDRDWDDSAPTGGKGVVAKTIIDIIIWYYFIILYYIVLLIVYCYARPRYNCPTYGYIGPIKISFSHHYFWRQWV